MDSTEVTNEQLAAFVAATGYVTVAEQKPTLEEFPGAPPENLVAGSTVFAATPKPVPLKITFSGGATLPGPTGDIRPGRTAALKDEKTTRSFRLLTKMPRRMQNGCSVTHVSIFFPLTIPSACLRCFLSETRSGLTRVLLI